MWTKKYYYSVLEFIFGRGDPDFTGNPLKQGK
jgi:hypothetical protein